MVACVTAFLCWGGGLGGGDDTWQQPLIDYHSAGHLVNSTLARSTHTHTLHAVLQGVVN